MESEEGGTILKNLAYVGSKHLSVFHDVLTGGSNAHRIIAANAIAMIPQSVVVPATIRQGLETMVSNSDPEVAAAAKQALDSLKRP